MDENLVAALRGTLKIIEKPELVGAEPDSPLAEATADSINFLLDEINQALAEGMPEKITDEKLALLVDMYRAQALERAQEDRDKKPRAPRGSKKKPDPEPEIWEPPVEITL